MISSEQTPLPGLIDAATLTPEAMLALFPNFTRVWREIEVKTAEKLTLQIDEEGCDGGVAS